MQTVKNALVCPVGYQHNHFLLIIRAELITEAYIGHYDQNLIQKLRF